MAVDTNQQVMPLCWGRSFARSATRKRLHWAMTRHIFHPSRNSRWPLAGVVAVLAFAQAGCGAGWRQLPALEPDTLKPRQQVRVWSGGERWQRHSVVLTSDSVSGVHFLKPVDCTACRQALPRAAVDSIQVGNPMAGFWKTFGLTVGGSLAARSQCTAVSRVDAIRAIDACRASGMRRLTSVCT
jgi:hypothetical protein